LQPYGEVWRAGANYNTTIDVSDPLRVEGQLLGKGTYGLHMIPGASSWVVIFSKNSTSWGSFTYDSTEDALRVRVTPYKIAHQEALTYSFDEPQPTSVVVTMRWDDVAVPFRLQVDTPHLVAQKLRLQLRGRAQTEWESWEEAANYLLENSLDAGEALAYADRSIAIEDRFENEITRARALRALGRNGAADSAQSRAIGMGSQAQVYSFARTLQRLGQQRAALEIFLEDSRKNPGTSTSHLEGARLAVAAGDYPRAISEIKKAIALAGPAMKGPLQEVLAQLQNGVDINR
jgi:tetratricopeptide (TPR) repeat protein